MRYATLLCLLALTACTEYWVRPNTSNATAGQDLTACRQGAGNLTMMYELEKQCMTSKGYTLSSSPAAE